jgi:glycosyltransferase involved in cell wall biosynthesis
MIPQMDFDLLFFLQDTFILDFLPELIPHLKNRGKDFRSICYFPIDGIPKKKWIENVNVVDYLVAYSEFGKNESMKVLEDCQELDVIPHGVNTSDYYVHTEDNVKAFRANYFNRHKDKFIFTNLNRNQQRKDIPRTIAAYAEFRKHTDPDASILYLHMAKVDQGWNLPEVCASYGFTIKDDVLFPENFGPNQGYPREIVNMIYNASDCIVSTTLGEGWGLSWSEAMATNTPIIMPSNTALVEAIDENKGYMVKSGSNPSLHTVLPNDNEVIRPLVDVEDMAEKMLHVYNNYDDALAKSDKAYKWATTKLDWQRHVVPRWVKVFDKMYDDLKSKEKEVAIPDTNKILDAEEF